MAPHSSTLAWKIPWTEEPGRLQSMGSLRVGHNWATSLSLFTFMHWRRKWQPTPVFLPGESQGLGSLMGCCLWGRTESDWSDLAAAAALTICEAKDIGINSFFKNSPNSIKILLKLESKCFLEQSDFCEAAWTFCTCRQRQRYQELFATRKLLTKGRASWEHFWFDLDIIHPWMRL